ETSTWAQVLRPQVLRFPISKPMEVLRDDCSDGEPREENKLSIPKEKISEVHSYKVIVGRLKHRNSKEISLPGKFRQIAISTETFTSEKNNECNKPEKSFSLDSTNDADQKVLRIQNTDDNDKNDMSSNQNSASGKHEHTNRTQDFQSSKCKESLMDLSLLNKWDSILNTEKSCKCDVCEKVFHQSSALTRHQRIPTREKLYKCKECENSSLSQHKRIHTREKPYKCEAPGKSCDASDKSCSPSSGIIQHKKIHTRAKAYKCSRCERVFSHSVRLTQHQKIHKEMPCKCTICGSDFCHTSYLFEHQRVHHEGKSYKYDEYGLAYIKQGIHFREKPYTYNECGKNFRLNSHLIQHQRIHTGMKLHECYEYGKAFSQTSCLIHHQIMHRKEKSYECNEYEGSFSHRSELILQQEVVTRQKVFDCDVREKNSSQRAHFVQYQSVHTKEDS
uniref:C2H2-type domain-containing protein n=1 Tax=Rhinopithecus roxellana TaxID=61622 RepID=A0A2K6RFK9_RHIRO